jgi:replicative DNA helicase
MRLVARTGLLASMLESVIAEQLRVQAERAALQGRVRELEARLAGSAPAPLLPAGALSRIQRAQQARDDLRADLRRLRERYADCDQ